MRKVALITTNIEPEWISCKSISANIQSSYSLLRDAHLRKFYFNSQDTAYDARAVALGVIKWGADQVVFLEHSPHPASFVAALAELEPQFKPDLVFHVYGDFTLNVNKWLGLESTLKKFRTRFICASTKQATLVKKFLNAENVTPEVLSFPVDEKLFFYSPENRQLVRHQLGLQQETLFLYTGRLSLQKNILPLIRAFELYQRQIQPQSYLLLAGPTDDLGNPYLGKTAPPGLMSYDIQTLIHSLFPQSRRHHIQFLGQLSPRDLAPYYSAADAYVSLSTHHDEDYGMSPAESLLAGCPCILSNWGGFTDFHHMSPRHSKLIPVQLKGGSVAPQEIDALKALVAHNNLSDSERRELAQNIQDLISIPASSQKLQRMLQSESNSYFKGFSPLFRKLGQSFDNHPEAPLSFDRTYSSLYKEIYDAYRN